MPFMWITVQVENEEGPDHFPRILVNTDQICTLSGRVLSMSDAETYLLTLVSANEVRKAVGPPPINHDVKEEVQEQPISC